MDKLIRIGIVDDNPGVRVAVRGLLANAKDIIVVGEGVNGEEAVQLADTKPPDVLLLDVELPALSGYEAVKLICENSPQVKVLALSTYNDPMYILGMLENGAAGYLTKDEAPGMLLIAVRSIMHDHVKWISPKVASQVSKIQMNDKTFTGRELEILRYIVIGKPKEEILQELDLKDNLFERYIDLLLQKFDVTNIDALKEAARDVISTTPS
jgi:two-component system NarL family response regulator